MREKVLEFLTKEYPSIDFTNESLIDNGILDSLILVEIISALSMEFGVVIPYEEIIPENFNSVIAISDMIEKLM